MSDKQRADHAAAKYWNGFITRTEAQKVFDEHGQVLMGQAMAIQKLDAVVSCIADKLGIKADDVNNWLKLKTEEANKQAAQAPPEIKDVVQEAPNAGQDSQQEPSSIILAG